MVSLNIYKKRSGYTLIEMVAVIGILALVISLTAGVLLAVVRAYDNQRVYAEIQRNGDFVMRFIEENVRNAKSVGCIEITADSTKQPCTGSAGVTPILEISDDSDTYYIGMYTDPEDPALPDDDICGGAKGIDYENNGFIFLSSDITNFTDSNFDNIVFDNIKMTNDSARGVDVNDFTFQVNSSAGEPTQVIVTMDISDSVCGTVRQESEVRSFQSFVTVRGSYSN